VGRIEGKAHRAVRKEREKEYSPGERVGEG
jgi:hypothetical protein